MKLRLLVPCMLPLLAACAQTPALVAPAPAPGAVRVERSESSPVTADLPDDPEVAKVLEPKKMEIHAYFDKVLVTSPGGLYRGGRNGEENRLGYWVADLMRVRAEKLLGVPVKFAITNSGGIRANLRRGPVKVADIFEVMPFENELVLVQLTGEQVVQVIQEGIRRRGGEPCSGVRAEVKGTPEKGEFTVTWADGGAIDPKEVVWVATSDYLANNGEAVPTLLKGTRLTPTGLSLRQLLLDACVQLSRLKATLDAPASGRYVIAPEMQQAIRDKKLQW